MDRLAFDIAVRFQVGLGVLKDGLRFALSACRMALSLSQVTAVTASIDKDMKTSVPKDG
jgi:hypothetical protein